MLKRMMTNSAVYALGDVTVRFSGLLLIPLYTRYLTPEDYGVLSIANTFTAILAVFMMLSLNGAFTRFYFDDRDIEKQKNLLSTLTYFLLLWALALGGGLYLGGERLFGNVMEIAFHPYLSLAIGIALAGLLPQMILTTFQVQEYAGKYALYTIFSFLITASLVIYHVVFLEEGARGSLEGTLTGMLMMSAFALFLLKKRWLVATFNADSVVSSLKYSLPLVPHLLLIWVMMGSDVFILQYFRPMEEVGIYSLGYTLGFAFFVVTGALSRAWTPILYRHADDEAHSQALSQVVTTMLMFMMFVVACSMLFLKEAIMMITVESFYDVALIIPWVALSAVFHVVYISFVNIIFYHKKTGSIAMVTAFAALCNIILNIMFIPEYGMQAAAISTAVAYVLQMGVVWWLSRSLMVIPYDKKKVIITVLVCSLMYGAGHLVGSFESLFLVVVLKVLFIISAIYVLYLMGVVRWKDIEELKSGESH